MPFDSEGNFTRIHNWEDDRLNDIDIASDRHDEEDDNFAEALSSCMLRDGRCTMSGNLDMKLKMCRRVRQTVMPSTSHNSIPLTVMPFIKLEMKRFPVTKLSAVRPF